MANSVIGYFANLPMQNGYTTIKRTVTLAAGIGTVDYGNVPEGTQLVAIFINDPTFTLVTPNAACDTIPRLNGTSMGFGRSDVAAPGVIYDWAPYTFTAGQQGILTVDLDGGAVWGATQVDVYLYVYIPQIPCP
jgi:hypothetical protein